VASWARYDEGTDEQGNPIDVVDRLKDTLVAAAVRQRQDPLSFISNREVFGDLIDNEKFVAAYSDALASLHHRGSKEALHALES
jgi:mannitol 2-dehydrogenase